MDNGAHPARLRRWLIAAGLSALCAALAIAARDALERSPQWAEQWYSRGAYAWLSQVLSRMTGMLPFSLAELIIVLALIAAPAALIVSATRAVRQREKAVRYVARVLAFIIMTACALVTLFYVVWGYNYSRVPYAQTASYDTGPAGVTELRGVCEALASKAAALRALMPEDGEGVSMLADGNLHYLKRVSAAYNNAASGAPWLAGNYGDPKPVMLSMAMCQAQITGIYIPFTFEANVNTLGPAHMLPATACHEAAHQRGFAREDEANFIAYYVCMASDDVDFQYSGLMLALLYAGNALADADYDAYQALRAQYTDAMRRDLRAYSAFWEQFKGPVKEAQTRINDAYLKSNGQEDGVKSYGRMVDLLIAEYRQRP